MSKGLGIWQRRILGALPESRNADNLERGMAFYIGDTKLWHRARGIDIILPRQVYDLAVVRSMLMHGVAISDPRRESMQQAISRAVQSLISRRELEQLSLVPVEDYRNGSIYGEVPFHLIHHLADGTYLDYGTKQVRFVTRPPDLA